MVWACRGDSVGCGAGERRCTDASGRTIPTCSTPGVIDESGEKHVLSVDILCNGVVAQGSSRNEFRGRGRVVAKRQVVVKWA